MLRPQSPSSPRLIPPYFGVSDPSGGEVRGGRRVAIRTAAVVLGAVALTIQSTRAEAACAVDLIETRIDLKNRERRDQAWIFVEDHPKDCESFLLRVDPGATPKSFQVRVRRSDSPNIRLRSERLHWIWSPLGPMAEVDLRGVRPGDAVRVDLSFGLGTGPQSWAPGTWGYGLDETGVPVHKRLPTSERLVGVAALEDRPPPKLSPHWSSGPVPQDPPLTFPKALPELRIHLYAHGVVTEPAEMELRQTLLPGETIWIPWPHTPGTRTCVGEAPLHASPDPLGCQLSLPDTETSPKTGILRAEGRPGTLSVDALTPPWPGLPQGSTIIITGQGLSFAQYPNPIRAGQPGGAWVTEVGGAQYLADREKVLSWVADGAFLASMPEPAIPMSMRALAATTPPGTLPRMEDIEAPIEAILLHLRQELTIRPGPRPLQPRGLLLTTKEGAATPWEAALILSSYLRQLRIDSQPIPVRTTEAPPFSPLGWTEAVVLVPTTTGPLFLAPGCRACAPGELPQAWSRAQLLSREHQNLPLVGTGTQVDERTAAAQSGPALRTLRLEGEPARALREALLALPPEERVPWIEAYLATDQETFRLLDQQGLGELGAAAVLRLEINPRSSTIQEVAPLSAPSPIQ